MFFPEFLFKLSSRDEQVTWLDPIFANDTLSLASVAITRTLLTVPNDRALVLQNVGVIGDPGAAQSCTALSVFAQPPIAGPSIVIIEEWLTAVADLTQTLFWTGSILVPPGWLIRSVARFSAAAAANVSTTNGIGLLMPVGNIQRV